MANACRVSRRCLNLWRHRHPAFADTLERAKQLSQVHWEKLGEANLHNPHFQDQVWWLRLQRFSEYRQPNRVNKDHVTIAAIERVTTRQTRQLSSG